MASPTGTNSLYNIARKKFALGEINWLSSPITCTLTKANTFDENHVKLGNMVSSDWWTGPQALAGKTVETNGAVNATQVTFTSVTAGFGTFYAILLYINDATLSESIPIAYLGNAVGLSITPNGGNIIVTWDTGPNKIFRL